jgi:HAD superfamily hydrolase (TIGR01549 family)
MVQMVVFDVGETLVDETRHWSEWADWLGVPRFTFLAVLGSIIASGRHHREVYQIFSTHGYSQLLAERGNAGWRYEIRIDDFYPDALPCLEKLRELGMKIGVVGNQPAACEDSLGQLGVKLDLLSSSESWGLEKPSLRFFERLVEEANLMPHDICYVGDHFDNDIRPARAVGLRTVFLRRGPWALTLSNDGIAGLPDRRINTLSELPGVLQRLEA